MAGVIIHEWLEPHGGAENVINEIAETFPDAPIRALWNDSPGRFPKERVSETWLARTPLRNSKKFALPFMPQVWRGLGKTEAEWMLCSSHLFSHHARFNKGSLANERKFVYAYTPARYIWNPELDERGDNVAARVVGPALRRLDRRRAQEAYSIAGISKYVCARIERNWEREAELIYPPVDVASFSSESKLLNDADNRILDGLPSVYLLGASRFIPYKRLDEVISIGAATGIPVVLAGAGPDYARLKSLADAHHGLVRFVKSPSHGLLKALYERSLAYVFPAVEDFGIMPVEAMATGTPVISRGIGGASETIVDGVTGAHLAGTTKIDYQSAVDRIASVLPEDCVQRAWEFDKSRFHTRIRSWIGEPDQPRTKPSAAFEDGS